MIRTLGPAQLAIDIGLAVACVLLRVAIGIEGVALAVVVVAMGGALALRRVSPVLALGVAWLGAIVQLAAVLPPDLANLAILPVLYATARRGGAGLKWVGLGSAILGAVIATAYLTAIAYWSAIVGEVAAPAPSRVLLTATILLIASSATLVLSWTFGLLARAWAAARESRRREALAEQTVAVEQERNRIARDMHDVVAHSLAVVIAQADGARYARATDPEAVDSSLVTISSTAREALADVRLLLAQLRHDEAPGPQPVLADLDRLYGQLRASGLPVAIEETGTPAALPAGAQIAVYRIVQEALTNALRHGAGDGARVELTWQPDRVSGVISNRVARATAAAPAVPATTAPAAPALRAATVMAPAAAPAVPAATVPAGAAAAATVPASAAAATVTPAAPAVAAAPAVPAATAPAPAAPAVPAAPAPATAAPAAGAAPAPAAAPAGHGVDGMRERALLAGGTLGAAAHDERFVVEFTIPITSGGRP
ncbi:histidine kinase [Herbiconiux sp. KACC 21604]|uniref:histidine kinase n=1 Tax=unclassified Herbiconiux TaxID=2618217 RepID=UPI0014927DC4|nr:histidine kinase [Herbiconiux sp. SALV-R1]WPO85723.1 histidine kinase [Herbiconiux sp. KACC 21604]